MFLKSTRVYRFDTLIDTIDREFRRPKSDKRTETLMCSLDSSVILHAEPPPEHPGRRDGNTPVGIGNLGQGRDECRINNSLVDDQRQGREG